MLYASIPSSATANANTVLPINPLTGAMGTPIPVGNNPGKLALSSDGAYLYVGLNGDHTLQRINLSTSQIERTFQLPIDSLLSLATTVYDMHGVPGSPQSVVASLSRPASPGEAGAALFTDTGLASFLGNTFQNKDYGIDSFAFTSNPSIFYGYPFNATFLGETGISANTLSIITEPGFSCCDETTGSLVASDGTLLYTNSGEVWNPTNASLLGTYGTPPNLLFYEPAVVPDTANGRTFILDTIYGCGLSSGNTYILSFNQASYAEAGCLALEVQESAFLSDLNRWGADGFAFRSYYQTSSDEIVILRSSIVHTATGGTPSLSSLAPASAPVGAATSRITVTGSGFIPGTAVQWNGIALETVYVSATQLTAVVPSSLFATEGTALVTAVNPAPGGSSSQQTFTILGPAVTLSSTTAAFGVIQDGSVSPVTQINVENSGNAALTGLVLSITGTNASSFSQTTACGSTLAAGASCTVNLTFAPSTTGALQALLTLTDNAPTSPQTVGLTGTGESLTVTVTPSASSITRLQPLTVTVAVSGGSGNPTPTGSVTLSSGSFTSTAATLNNGSAQIVVQAGSLQAGSDTLTVTYAPDTASSPIYTGASNTASVTVNRALPTITWATPAAITYGTTLSTTQLDASSPVAGSFTYSPAVGTLLSAGSQTLNTTFTPTDTTDYTTATASATLTVNKATPGIGVAASASSAYVSNPVTFTATLSSAISTPTGTVSFYDGTMLLGTGMLSAGVATYTTSALAAGSHSITGVYSGDGNFVTVTSSIATETVENFTIGVSSGGSTTATASPGGQAAYTFTVAPPSGATFPGPITFTVTGLPAGATAVFTPNPVPAGAGSTNVSMTVTLPATASAGPENRMSRPSCGGLLPVALGLLLLPIAGRLRKSARALRGMVCLMAVALACAALVTGCGGGGGTGTQPQNYALTVTGTSGSLSNTFNVTLTVE
jgi:hypothetical protein